MSEHLSIPMDTFTPSTLTAGPKEAEQQDTQKQSESTNRESCILGKTPTPIYRHAAPSGPWPWMDFDEDVLGVTPSPNQSTDSDVRSWGGYPQSSFPNWTESQVARCKMLTDCPVGESDVFKVDVFHDGTFGSAGQNMARIKDSNTEAAYWDLLNRPREKNVRVRAIFVKNMTKEVLQMLGTRYIIEPFFFSSSTNWIPSRYQESLVRNQGDHITVILPFIRVIDETAAGPVPPPPQSKESDPSLPQEDEQMIDTQSPLYLDTCNKYILQDLLSVHMVRGVETSTIISCHPKLRMATANQLHGLIKRTGDSVYWSKIFTNSKDPTCLFLCFLWYAMYDWDEVFEVLYSHVNQLEQLVLNSEKIKETQHLHVLQAHLLYYRTLLEDFRKSVVFVQETENPAMAYLPAEERAESARILRKETDYLLSEIERLESQRLMQVMRLRNIINLAFATVNIEDSKHMKKLTVATVRDSAAMKQISYLTMVFLPANFMANVFSMNVTEINPQGGETLAHYIEGTVGLTVFAVWVAIALQVESGFFPAGSGVWRRAGWPIFYVWGWVYRWMLWIYRQVFGKQKTT